MKFPKYFNKNMQPRCEYCYNCRVDDGSVFICMLNNSIKNDKCSKFIYDPLMRVPDAVPQMPKFDSDDFAL
ncbi:MAG: hypothetical protein K6F76_04360 [Clostridiales bacterium]|nr:hypothetical protein [Clostridiales bacterium]